MVRIARELHREVATGEEAKRIYQIATYWKDANEALAKLGWPPNRRPGQRGFPIRICAGGCRAAGQRSTKEQNSGVTTTQAKVGS